jgi:hypothetical protein
MVPASIHVEKGEREREEEGKERDGGSGSDFAGIGCVWKMATAASIARSGWKMDWENLADMT